MFIESSAKAGYNVKALFKVCIESSVMSRQSSTCLVHPLANTPAPFYPCITRSPRNWPGHCPARTHRPKRRPPP